MPGELHGLRTEYERFGGGVPWSALLQPSIELLESGVPVSQGMAATLKVPFYFILSWKHIFLRYKGAKLELIPLH